MVARWDGGCDNSLLVLAATGAVKTAEKLVAPQSSDAPIASLSDAAQQRRAARTRMFLIAVDIWPSTYSL